MYNCGEGDFNLSTNNCQQIEIWACTLFIRKACLFLETSEKTSNYAAKELLKVTAGLSPWLLIYTFTVSYQTALTFNAFPGLGENTWLNLYAECDMHKKNKHLKCNNEATTVCLFRQMINYDVPTIQGDIKIKINEKN